MALEYVSLIALGTPDSSQFVALLEQDAPNFTAVDFVESLPIYDSSDIHQANSFENQADIFIDYVDTTNGFVSLLAQDVPNTSDVDLVDAIQGMHSNDLTISLMGSISPPPPAAPVLSGVGQDLNIDLSWPAVPTASSYNIYRSLVNGGPYTLLAANNLDLDYTDGALINGTTYYYVITAVGLGGDSAYSNQLAAVPVPDLPGAPINLIAVGQIVNIALAWDPPALIVPGYGFYYGTDYGGGSPNPPDSYNMYRSAVTGGPYSILASGLAGPTYNDPSAVPGTPYFYVVRGVNGSGEGPNSNEATATALPNPTVPAPIEFEVIVMWDPIAQTLTLSADLSGFKGKSVIEMTAFPGTTDVRPLLLNVSDPKVIFIQAKTQPIKVDMGPGFPSVTTGKVFLANLEQGMPPYIKISAVTETDILVICAGNP